MLILRSLFDIPQSPRLNPLLVRSRATTILVVSMFLSGRTLMGTLWLPLCMSMSPLVRTPISIELVRLFSVLLTLPLMILQITRRRFELLLALLTHTLGCPCMVLRFPRIPTELVLQAVRGVVVVSTCEKLRGRFVRHNYVGWGRYGNCMMGMYVNVVIR